MNATITCGPRAGQSTAWRREQVLDLLKRGTASRLAIAERLGSSGATVGMILRTLLREGRVRKVDGGEWGLCR